MTNDIDSSLKYTIMMGDCNRMRGHLARRAVTHIVSLSDGSHDELGSAHPRPSSAAASFTRPTAMTVVFNKAECGSAARPAGLARPAAPGGINLCGETTRSAAMSATTLYEQHALQSVSPYAQVARPKWSAAEPDVRPSQAFSAAGITPIDNTYLPWPLQAKWGKTRSLSPQESMRSPRAQVPHNLSNTQGFGAARPQTIDGLSSVREPYSPAIPTYRNKFDPLRYDTGFIRSPNYARGVPSAPTSPLRFAGIGSPPSMSPNSKQNKFGFDKVVLGTTKIPVSKTWLE